MTIIFWNLYGIHPGREKGQHYASVLDQFDGESMEKKLQLPNKYISIPNTRQFTISYVWNCQETEDKLKQFYGDFFRQNCIFLLAPKTNKKFPFAEKSRLSFFGIGMTFILKNERVLCTFIGLISP